MRAMSAVQRAVFATPSMTVAIGRIFDNALYETTSAADITPTKSSAIDTDMGTTINRRLWFQTAQTRQMSIESPKKSWNCAMATAAYRARIAQVSCARYAPGTGGSTFQSRKPRTGCTRQPTSTHNPRQAVAACEACRTLNRCKIWDYAQGFPSQVVLGSTARGTYVDTAQRVFRAGSN
ncbi:hypothetical protein BD413DRAFT_584230 [Trametes elegans]|nr:hypothetical protein BD413DRAFT_584230 [Trametes elegans]